MDTVFLTAPKTWVQWLQLYRLYVSAFPLSERKPFSVIVKKYREGIFDVWCLCREKRFCGLAFIVKNENLVLIDYLAIIRARRDQGIGSAALAEIRKHYAGKGIFLEIESVYEDAPDQAQRLRRKQFYLRCGMKPMNVMIQLFGVNMELLGFDCRISFDQYYRFYLENVGSWAAGHISHLPHPMDSETP